MKLNKTIGRVATTLVATAMLASVAVVPAFAENSNSPTPEEGVTLDTPSSTHTIELKKYLEKPANVFIPDATFEFSIAPSTTNPDVHGGNISGAAAMGTDRTIDTTPAEQADTSKLPAGTYELSDTADIVLTADTFGQPGTYYFDVTEQNGQYENGQTWSTSTLTLKVVVIDDGGLKIYGYSLYDPNNSSKKLDGFTNEYMGGKDGTPVTYTVTKAVTGNMATTADKTTAHFTFSVDIDNATLGKDPQEQANTKTYNIVVTHKDKSVCMGQTDSYTVTANGAATEVAIANGDQFVIYGLTENDQVTVTETGISTSEGNSTGASNFNDFTVTNSANSADGKTTGQKTVSSNSTVAFENNRHAINPTGIVMDVAPYALLVVVAAAGCFVFMRKRRED